MKVEVAAWKIHSQQDGEASPVSAAGVVVGEVAAQVAEVVAAVVAVAAAAAADAAVAAVADVVVAVVAVVAVAAAAAVVVVAHEEVERLVELDLVASVFARVLVLRPAASFAFEKPAKPLQIPKDYAHTPASAS